MLKEDVKLFAEHFELWEQLRNKSFLITGATGLIGSVMIKCLLELNRQKQLGIKLVAVVRNIEKAQQVFGEDYPLVNFLKLELHNISTNSIHDSIDYIVHLASPTASKYFVEHPVETLRTAIEGTTTILEYAKAAKTKAMIYASSLEVYGSNNTDEWIDESFQGYVNPTEVRSSYNIGKRACECLCHSYAKEYDVNVMIARLTQTTGAGITKDDNRVIVQFAHQAAEGKDIILHTTGKAARPYCYTTDAISALLYILLRGGSGQAYNVANADTYISAHDMAEYLKRHFNPSINVYLKLRNDMGYAPETKLKLDTAKIESLGWKPRYGLIEMFERLITFVK